MRPVPFACQLVQWCSFAPLHHQYVPGHHPQGEKVRLEGFLVTFRSTNSRELLNGLRAVRHRCKLEAVMRFTRLESDPEKHHLTKTLSRFREKGGVNPHMYTPRAIRFLLVNTPLPPACATRDTRLSTVLPTTILFALTDEERTCHTYRFRIYPEVLPARGSAFIR